MSGPGPYGYTQDDSQDETEATDREQSAAWHTARADYKQDYGSLDPTENPQGAEEAFGPVAGQNEDRDWDKYNDDQDDQDE